LDLGNRGKGFRVEGFEFLGFEGIEVRKELGGFMV
jgi:hypothetical protein